MERKTLEGEGKMAVKEPEFERQEFAGLSDRGSKLIEELGRARIVYDENGKLDFDKFLPPFEGDWWPNVPHECDVPDCDRTTF